MNTIIRICGILLLIGMLTGCEKKDKFVISAMEEPEQITEAEELPEEEKEQEESIPVLVVHICGAVQNPGVYFLNTGDRIYQAIELAGGFTEDACTWYLNQASVLEDGSRVYVPTIEQAEADLEIAGIEGAEEKASSDGLVNLNTASEAELMTLPGVGSAKAAKIVEYRSDVGRFQTIEDIMKIEGIKEGLFEKIKDRIKV